MTEGRALALVCLGTSITIIGGYVVLSSLGAEGGAVTLMALVVAGVTVQFTDAIVLHYSEERRKRSR